MNVSLKRHVNPTILSFFIRSSFDPHIVPFKKYSPATPKNKTEPDQWRTTITLLQSGTADQTGRVAMASKRTGKPNSYANSIRGTKQARDKSEC